jgi:hypothetical protein
MSITQLEQLGRVLEDSFVIVECDDELRRDDNMLADGNLPDADAKTPDGGAY